MPIILPNNTLRRQLPQTRVVVRARGDEIRRVGGECAVPDPALVLSECGLERVRVCGQPVHLTRLDVADLPYLGGVVCGAGGELLDVRGEEDARDVLLVGAELGHRVDICAVLVRVLGEFPDEDVALERSCVSSVSRRRDRIWNGFTGQGGGCEGAVLTALLAAHKREPSLATVTLATDCSSSGMISCEQLFSAKSQILTLPLLSQLIISPWLGWITTSLTGDPWL